MHEDPKMHIRDVEIGARRDERQNEYSYCVALLGHEISIGCNLMSIEAIIGQTRATQADHLLLKAYYLATSEKF